MTARPGFATAGLSAAQILDLWESGSVQPPVARALGILAAGAPGRTWDDLARLPSGRREGYLLAVYERTFGPRLAGQGQCPHCATQVEFDLDTRALAAAGATDAGVGPFTLAVQDWLVSYRLPDSRDLAQLAAFTDLEEARAHLLRCCILAATQGDHQLDTAQLPHWLVGQVVEQMADRDPLAVIELEMRCPDCGWHWPLLLDICTFLWRRIETQAGRLLHEVHTLARAYGWRESEILAMTQTRRWAYLELLG